MINVDNVSGEVIPYLIESAIERGASNVHVVPALTKKGRPEFLLFVDVEESKLEPVIGFILAELGSLGYRIIRDEHIPSDYVVEKVKLNLSSLGISFDREVTIKVIRRKDKTILTANVEYEDLQSIAEELEKQHVNLPMMKLKSMIESNFLKKSFDKANKKLKSQSRRL
ncbi:MAG: nickel insertion protein [Candidatus Thorarchaeota archaeon]